MKKKASLVSVIVIFSLIISSCDIFDVIDIDFTSDPVVIKMAIAPTETQNISRTYEEIDSEIKEQIENHGGIIENLESVVISSIKINLVSGAEDFNAFKNVEIMLSTGTLSEKKVAWIDNIPADTNKVVPQHTGDNIKDYLDNDLYGISLSGEVIETFTDTIIVDIVMEYNITL